MSDKNECSKWNKNLINLWQSPEDRREKYHLCRSLGCNSYHAKRMRDWRLPKIERLFNLVPKQHIRADGKLITESVN